MLYFCSLNTTYTNTKKIIQFFTALSPHGLFENLYLMAVHFELHVGEDKVNTIQSNIKSMGRHSAVFVRQVGVDKSVIRN